MVRVVLRTVVVTGATLLASWLFILLVWQIGVSMLGASYIAKTPLDVYDYLFTRSDVSLTTPAENRASLMGLLGVTLKDAAIGFGFGTSASVALAIVFAQFPVLEDMFFPLAMIMRTVPLVGFAPVIFIICGNGTLSVALIGTIIVFFPILVNVSVGLSSASPQARDLIAVYGGGRWSEIRKVGIPSALPHLFAAVKIALPFSLVGAMLFEWLFSLHGLGGEISAANASSRYQETWAIVVVVTGVSILLYDLVALIEAPILAAWGPRAGLTTGG